MLRVGCIADARFVTSKASNDAQMLTVISGTLSSSRHNMGGTQYGIQGRTALVHYHLSGYSLSHRYILTEPQKKNASRAVKEHVASWYRDAPRGGTAKVDQHSRPPINQLDYIQTLLKIK
jgi:hypothetical protein